MNRGGGREARNKMTARGRKVPQNFAKTVQRRKVLVTISKLSEKEKINN